MNQTSEELKILFVGNSFAVDTMEHTAHIAHSLGVPKVKFGTLYVGGCSIEMHARHVAEDAAAYTYYVNEGSGWETFSEVKISDAVRSDNWDWIAIQHGTRGTSRYTSCECYEKLASLVDALKDLAPSHTKIAFNLTWLGEPTYPHHEIISYGGNMALMRENLVKVTKEMVLGNPSIDLIVPTGTAIENARTSRLGPLTRDGFHLSKDQGRFIAGLTFISTVTGIDAKGITWAPDGVDAYAMRVAVESVKNAQISPFQITRSEIV